MKLHARACRKIASIIEKYLTPRNQLENFHSTFDPEQTNTDRAILTWFPYQINMDYRQGTLIKKTKTRTSEFIQTYIYNQLYIPEFESHPKDWPGLLKEYQDQRWHYMQEAGIQPPRDSEELPHALDVGCGTGGLADLLYHKGYKVTGIDLSSEAIKRARAYFPHSRFMNTTLKELASRGEHFDLITLCHVFEHAPESETLLKEIADLLRPDGHVYIELPLFRKDANSLRPDWYLQHDHCYEFTWKGLENALADSPFEVLKHDDGMGVGTPQPYQYVGLSLRS